MSNYDLRPFRPGEERSVTLERNCGPDCTPECSVIVFSPKDENGQPAGIKMIHGVIHRKGCTGRDVFGDSLIDEVIHGEIENPPERLKEMARECQGYNLIREVVMLARAGKDYKTELEELKPIVHEVPRIQEIVKTLANNLAAL